MKPLIPISKTEVQRFSSLSNILYNKLTKNACSLCSYQLNGKIRTEEKYKECETNFIKNVVLPNYLLLAFDLSSENEPDNQQYSNLNKYKDEIKSLISEEFQFNCLIHKLKGIICCPSLNHYSSYCHYCEVNDLNLNTWSSYYYNDLHKNGLVEEIKEDSFDAKIS